MLRLGYCEWLGWVVLMTVMVVFGVMVKGGKGRSGCGRVAVLSVVDVGDA